MRTVLGVLNRLRFTDLGKSNRRKQTELCCDAWNENRFTFKRKLNHDL